MTVHEDRADEAKRRIMAAHRARCARDKVTPRGFARTKLMQAVADPDPPPEDCKCGHAKHVGPCHTKTDAARGAVG